MKKVAHILHDIERLTMSESISLSQTDELIDFLHYTPFKQYLLCLKVGIKPEDATAILLKHLAEDIFEKTPFTEMRIHSTLGDTALQETVYQPIMLIAKPLFKVVRDENGQVSGLKIDTLQYENYELNIGTYLTHNEYVVITNFKEVIIFGRSVSSEFEPLHILSFADLIALSTEKNSLFGIAQSFEKSVNQELILRQFTKTIDKLAEGKGISTFLFFKFAEAYQVVPYQFLSQLFLENKKLWESQNEDIIFEKFMNSLTNWLAVHYAFTIPEKYSIDFLTTEKLLFAKSAKIKNLTDYNYGKMSAFIVGKAFENIAGNTNDFSEEIYDIFCESLIKQLFENQVDKVIENIEKGNLKKATQLFEELQKKTIVNPFFDSGIVFSKLLTLIFTQYQRIEKQIDSILDEKQNLLDKDEKWNKLAALKEEFGFNDLRKFIIHIIQNQLFIDFQAMPTSLSTTAKLNIYISAIRLAPSAFNFRKQIAQDERIAFKKFEYPNESAILFSALAAMIPLANWKKESKILITKFLNQVADNGFISLVLPAELLFSDSEVSLRQILLVENTVIEVVTFEQGKTTWALLTIQKKTFDKKQVFSLKQHSHSQADEIKYANQLIVGFSPIDLHLIKFASSLDYQLCSKIKGKNLTLAESNYVFKNEFRLSNDTNFFLRVVEENTLPLYENRLIDTYALTEDVKYFIPREKAHNQLLSKEINALKRSFALSQKNYEIVGIFNEKGFLLDYQCERLVVKQLSTDSQESYACALIPVNTFVEGSLLYLSNFQYQRTDNDLIQHILPKEDILFILALLNSWTLNFYVKTTHLADISFVPLPKERKGIVEKVSQLLRGDADIRFELERQIAKELYNLEDAEFAYICTYFQK